MKILYIYTILFFVFLNCVVIPCYFPVKSMNVQVYFFSTNCFVLLSIKKTLEKNVTFPSNHLFDWKSYEIGANMITIAIRFFS